jgi:LPS export ABC transporter protein LptC/lipopolysaccharide transport protein LptA
MIKIFLSLVMLFSFSGVVCAQNNGEQKFQGFNLEGFTDSGEKSWDVNGDTASMDGTAIELKNVVANSYGKTKMNVTAETGVIDQVEGIMQLEKDVIMTSEKGAQLITESLSWDRKKDLVTTQDEVMITDDSMTLTGIGMKAKPGLGNAQINEDVTVRINTKSKKKDGGKFVTITSDGPMVIDQSMHKATFEDNVVAVQETRTLKANRMEVYFTEDLKEIKDLICIGNVEILQGENKTFAERAVYKSDQNKLVLTGRPKLILLTEGE